MKKISFILMSTVTLFFSACFDSEFETHQTNFYPSNIREMTFYADQTNDSIKLFSYDPWTAAAVAKEVWFSFTPTSGAARPGTPAITRLDITMPQNTTGKNRQGSILVNTYDDNKISMPIRQCSWLNIMYPNPLYEGNTVEDRTARFDLFVNANEKSSTISFHIYQEDFSLTHKAPWLTFVDSIQQGTNQLVLNFEPNPNKEDRKDTLVLTSGLISTPIFVTQQGKIEKE